MDKEPVSMKLEKSKPMPLWVRLLAIFGAALLCVGLYLYLGSPPPISQEKCEYTYSPADCYKPGPILGPIVLDSINQEERSVFIKDKRDLNAQEGVWRATNAVVFLTIAATALAGAGLFMIFKTLEATRDTFDTTRAMLRQAEVTTSEAIKANINAGKSLVEAEKSANSAAKAAMPYIFPMLSVEFKPDTILNEGTSRQVVLPDHGQNLIVKISLKNVGRTPVKGGRIDSFLMHAGSPEKRRQDDFDVIAAGESVHILRQMEVRAGTYYKATKMPHVFVLTDFYDVDGKKTTRATASYIRFLDSEGRIINVIAFRGKTVGEIRRNISGVKFVTTQMDVGQGN